jgi:hypothetical protein
MMGYPIAVMHRDAEVIDFSVFFLSFRFFDVGIQLKFKFHIIAELSPSLNRLSPFFIPHSASLEDLVFFWLGFNRL